MVVGQDDMFRTQAYAIGNIVERGGTHIGRQRYIYLLAQKGHVFLTADGIFVIFQHAFQSLTVFHCSLDGPDGVGVQP